MAKAYMLEGLLCRWHWSCIVMKIWMSHDCVPNPIEGVWYLNYIGIRMVLSHISTMWPDGYTYLLEGASPFHPALLLSVGRHWSPPCAHQSLWRRWRRPLCLHSKDGWCWVHPQRIHWLHSLSQPSGWVGVVTGCGLFRNILSVTQIQPTDKVSTRRDVKVYDETPQEHKVKRWVDGSIIFSDHDPRDVITGLLTLVAIKVL